MSDVPANTTSTRLPLHIQISEMLMREIKAGILADGEKLQPERELAASLGIAVGTLRKALSDLEEKGMLERVHGSGNYVRNRLDVDNVYALFRLELVSGGGLPTATLLSLKHMSKPTRLPEFGKSGHAFRFRRLRKLNNINAAVEEIWLDGSYAKEIDSADVSESLYQYYRDVLGFWITRAEDRVGVARLPDWSPDDMQCKDALACGYIERLSRDNHGDTAEYSRTWFNPAVARFVAR